MRIKVLATQVFVSCFLHYETIQMEFGNKIFAIEVDEETYLLHVYIYIATK